MIFDDDVDDTSTMFDNVELFVTTIDGIDDDVDDECWFEEFWCDCNRSIEDDESDNGRLVADGGGWGWESTETVDDCVSKHIKTLRIVILVWEQ